MREASPRKRVRALIERDAFARSHPKSRGLFERSGRSLMGGVPMTWMMMWSGGYPVFAERAEGSTVVDGNEYANFCLGDTGAMTGHAPQGVAATAAEQAKRAITTMMPSPDAPAVGEALAERFGLPLWQVTLSGAGRALIEGVYAEADRRGVDHVYWHTQQYNAPARSLYDVVGHATSFVVYER